MTPTPRSRPVSQLRGVDTSTRPETQIGSSSSNIFVQKDGLDPDTSILSLGLEEALGKDGNWLTKKGNPSIALPEINRDQLNLDFERPLSQIFRNPASSTTDLMHDAEEGLINHQRRPNQRNRSPVRTLSRAVKTISTRLLGQKHEEEYPPSTYNLSTANSIQYYDTTYNSPLDASIKSSNLSPAASLANTYTSRHTYTTEVADDEASAWRSSMIGTTGSVDDPGAPVGPLRLIGNSLKFFGPDNKFRLFLYEVLHQPWVEPFSYALIIFQTVVLTIGNAKNIYEGIEDVAENNYTVIFASWTAMWENWCMLAIFLCYTAIAGAKIIAYGLWDDSQRKELLGLGKKDKALPEGGDDHNLFSRDGLRRRHLKNAPLVNTFVNLMPGKTEGMNFGNSIYASNVRIPTERAFLRGSWNRLHFIAIIGYWISLLLTIKRLDDRSEAFVFRLISSLPILHLLNLTSGTSSVLRSLKFAAPLLVNVGLFVGFFW